MSQENNFIPEQESYKKITPFRLFVKSNFPFIEATYEALDNYGLYCKIVEYLNDVIANENTVESNVAALYDAFVSLNDYVANYFDNLDVQDEINNKLDELVVDGTLNRLIGVYIMNDVNPLIAEQANRITTLNQRVDNIVALPEGSTTGDAELIDIRVGANGVVYDTAGDAVRGQYLDIANNFIIGNKYNPETAVDNKLITTTTTPVDYNGVCYNIITNMTPINNEISINIVNFPYSVLGTNIGIVVRGDGAGAGDIFYRLTGSRQSNESFTITTDSNSTIYTLYINNSMANKNNFGVYVNHQETEYTPYGIATLKRNSLPEKQSVIYGKSLACDGDSIAYGAGDTGGYAAKIATDYNMTVQNISVSGGTIASDTYYDNEVARHWVCESVSNIETDSDYIIIEGGVNDYWLNVDMFPSGVSNVSDIIPTTKPSDTTNVYNAMESICFDLVNTYTTNKCMFLFPHKIRNIDWINNTKNYTYKDLKDMQKKVLKKWGIPYLDLSEETSMDTIFTSIASAYTASSDGTHPNASGYETFYVPKIVNKMENM